MFTRNPISPIATLEAEIAKLSDRQAGLEAQLKSCQEAVGRAAAERRDLLAISANFDDPEFVGAKQSLEKAEARLRDLEEALELIAKQRRNAEDQLAALNEQDARADEARRADKMLAEAKQAAKELDKALSKFIASFAPLMQSGNLASGAASEFRANAALLVGDAVAATEEYRDAIASGARPLPTRIAGRAPASDTAQVRM